MRMKAKSPYTCPEGNNSNATFPPKTERIIRIPLKTRRLCHWCYCCFQSLSTAEWKKKKKKKNANNGFRIWIAVEGYHGSDQHRCMSVTMEASPNRSILQLSTCTRQRHSGRRQIWPSLSFHFEVEIPKFQCLSVKTQPLASLCVCLCFFKKSSLLNAGFQTDIQTFLYGPGAVICAWKGLSQWPPRSPACWAKSKRWFIGI